MFVLQVYKKIDLLLILILNLTSYSYIESKYLNTKKNSLLTVIYVVYVNPRCENGHNSSVKGYKEWIGGNPI